MKDVLIIVESALFREYLCRKLEENGIEAVAAANTKEGVSKMRAVAPDLIIMDYLQDHQALIELLKKKKSDPNTVNTPVIILAQKLEQKHFLEIAPYNVKKIFNKPIRIDAFFSTLSEITGRPFKIDEKPGIIEVHVNESILFIEIAQGLNRDKLDLLHFKISELMELYQIHIPKIIIMLSDIKLGFTDMPNIHKLINTVLKTSRANPNLVRFLTTDDFVKQFINGQKEYAGIKVTSSLMSAVDGLVNIGAEEGDENKAERIGKMILQSKANEDEEAMLMKFEAEEKKISLELIKDSIQNIKIAVVDDDFVIQELIKNTFKITDSFVYTFSDGDEFLQVSDNEEFDLVFLDLNMPKVSGFEVLSTLAERNIHYPIIVLSAISQRETMMKVIQMGIKSYLVKPIKPEDIFMKSLEILKANF